MYVSIFTHSHKASANAKIMYEIEHILVIA